MDGLCRRGSSGVWHHGYLEYRRSIPLGLGTSQFTKGGAGLDYGRVGRGKRKGRRKTGRRKREEDKTEVEKVEEAPGMTARSSRRFRACFLIGPTQGRSRSDVGLHRSGNMRTLREYGVVECNAFGGKWAVVAIRGSAIGCARGLALYQTLPSECPSPLRVALFLSVCTTVCYLKAAHLVYLLAPCTFLFFFIGPPICIVYMYIVYYSIYFFVFLAFVFVVLYLAFCVCALVGALKMLL